MECPEKANSPESESTLVVARGWWEGGKWGVTANGFKVFLGGDENILELDSGEGCTTL